MRRRLIATLAALALLVAPAGALAQSAGDEQYADPFGDAEQPTQDQGGSNGSPAPDPGSGPAGACERLCLCRRRRSGHRRLPAPHRVPSAAQRLARRAVARLGRSRCAVAPSRPPRCLRGSSPPHRAGVGSARDGDAAVSASVAINARAAVRTRTGGVERVASQLVARLPALRPDRYRVVAPRPALAHRAGQAWEQVALPLPHGVATPP